MIGNKMNKQMKPALVDDDDFVFPSFDDGISKSSGKYCLGAVLKGGSEIFDLNKEYGLLSYYDSYSNKNKISSFLNFLNHALETGQWTFLNLDEAQLNMNQQFKFLALKKRYLALITESQGILHCSSKGFHIEDHTFETLDEVKRALANKMFL